MTSYISLFNKTTFTGEIDATDIVFNGSADFSNVSPIVGLVDNVTLEIIDNPDTGVADNIIQVKNGGITNVKIVTMDSSKLTGSLNIAGGTINFSLDLVPNVTDIYNLGSALKRVNRIYVKDITLNGTDLNTFLDALYVAIQTLIDKTQNQSATSGSTVFTGTMSITGNLTVPSILLNGTDLDTRLTNDESNITILFARTQNQSAISGTTTFSGLVNTTNLVASNTVTSTNDFISTNSGIETKNFRIGTVTGGLSSFVTKSGGIAFAPVSGGSITMTTIGSATISLTSGSSLTLQATTTTSITAGSSNLSLTSTSGNVNISATAASQNINVNSTSLRPLNDNTMPLGDSTHKYTNVYTVDVNLSGTSLNTALTGKANLSGATFTGAITAPNITDTALSAGYVKSSSGGLLSSVSSIPASDVTGISGTYVPYTGATTNVTLGAQNLSTTGRIGVGTTNLTTAGGYFVGGVQNLGGEESIIRLLATGSNFAKLEIQGGTGSRLYEIRSKTDGTFDIVDRTGVAQRFLIDTVGAISILGTLKSTGAMILNSNLGTNTITMNASSYDLQVSGTTRLAMSSTTMTPSVDYNGNSKNMYSINRLSVGTSDVTTAGCTIATGPNDGSGDSMLLNLSTTGGNGAKLRMAAFTGGSALFNMRADGTLYITNSNTSNAIRLNSTGFISVTDNVYKPTAGSWLSSSDSRIKKNIQNNPHGLNEILQLRPVTYQFNQYADVDSSLRSNTYLGLIADEVKPILPECVGTMPNSTFGTILSLDITPITYALINSIKELHTTITNQATTITTLQTQINDLTTKYNNQQAQINSMNTTLGLIKSLLRIT